MNKSKFLKKSLAMVLAIMMVVAMIPLGASAAEGDFTVIVNGTPATGTGDVLTTSVTNLEDVAITGVAAPDTTMVVLGKDGKPVEDVEHVNLTKEATVSGEVYTLKVEFRSTEAGETADPVVVKAYTLNITEKKDSTSDVNTIKAVKGIDNMSYYTIDSVNNEIKIYMPFGANVNEVVSGLSDANFTKTDSDENATVKYDDKKVTVTATDGSTRVYEVTVENLPGFETFSVTGQVGDSEIKAEGTTNTVKANVAFGTDMKKVVPTFTLGSTITKVTTMINSEEVEVKSGETVIDFSSSPVTFTLYAGEKDTTGVPVEVTLTANKNTEAALKTVKVTINGKASNEVAVSGTTVNVEMPKGVDFKQTATVDVTASDNATVSIPAQGLDFTGGTVSGVKVTGKTFVIRVTSEDGKTYTNYTVNLTEAASKDAVLNDFSVKYTKDGETLVYSAKNGTLTLPYMAQAELGLYKVYAQASTGATVNANSKNVSNGTTTLNDLDLATSKNEISVVVTNDDDTAKNTYTIAVKYEAAKTGYSITGAETTATTKVSAMTADNTYKVTVGTTTTTDNKSVKTLKVDVPFSFKAPSVYFSELNLSEGAVAYLDDGSGSLTKIKALDMDTYGEQSVTPLTLPTNALEDGKLTLTAAAKIYVVSEKDALTNYTDDDQLSGKAYNTYYVYGVKADAQEGKSLTSIKSTLDKNVTATLSGKDITITVPNSYNVTSYDEDTTPTFSLNFALSKMAALSVNKNGTDPFVSDNGSADTDNATQFCVVGGKLEYVKGTSAEEIPSDTLYVVPEIKDGSFNTYTVKVKVADAETGASLTSVKVNNTTATINESDRTVNVVLPYGSALNPVKLAITASKMATIEVGAVGTAFNPDETYDLNDDLKIIVTAEDKKTVRTYTLKATVAEQFKDVTPDDWFYEEVMQAAAMGLVSGTGNGYFSPKSNVKRGDFALMIARMEGYNEDDYTDSAFVDIDSDKYYSAAVAYCVEKGYLSGYEDGTFKGEKNINRQEMAKILAMVAGLDEVTTPVNTYADDAKISGWAKGYVYAVTEAGLMSGVGNNNFAPTNNTQRCQAAAVLVRLAAN